MQLRILSDKPREWVLQTVLRCVCSQRHLYDLYRHKLYISIVRFWRKMSILFGSNLHFCNMFRRICVERERLRAAELRGGAICKRQFVRRVPVGAMVQRRDGDFLLALFKPFRRQRHLHSLFGGGKLYRRFLQRRVQGKRRVVRASDLSRGAIRQRQFVRRVPVGSMVQRRHGNFLLAFFKPFRRQRHLHSLFGGGDLFGNFLQRRLYL